MTLNRTVFVFFFITNICTGQFDGFGLRRADEPTYEPTQIEVGQEQQLIQPVVQQDPVQWPTLSPNVMHDINNWSANPTEPQAQPAQSVPVSNTQVSDETLDPSKPWKAKQEAEREATREKREAEEAKKQAVRNRKKNRPIAPTAADATTADSTDDSTYDSTDDSTDDKNVDKIAGTGTTDDATAVTEDAAETDATSAAGAETDDSTLKRDPVQKKAAGDDDDGEKNGRKKVSFYGGPYLCNAPFKFIFFFSVEHPNSLSKQNENI